MAETIPESGPPASHNSDDDDDDNDNENDGSEVENIDSEGEGGEEEEEEEEEEEDPSGSDGNGTISGRSVPSPAIPPQTMTKRLTHRTSTKSLPGSLLQQRIHENSRYYANEDYHMPSDDAEATRLAITHQAYLLILDNKLTLAHIPPKTKRILDIGTGPGDWAIAIAERYPNAEVIATDISSTYQPGAVPPNVVFEIDDAMQEWTYTEPFDLVHIRGLAGAFADWGKVYKEAFRHLRKGGILEVADFGPITLAEQATHSYVSIYNGALQSAAEKAGTSLGLEHLKKPVLDAAGFSVAKAKAFQVPLGEWAEQPQMRVIGKMTLISVLEGLEATSLRLLTRELGWTEEGVRELCGKVMREITGAGRARVEVRFVVARKLITE